MDTTPRQRLVSILVYDGVNALDVGGVAEAFSKARFADQSLYALRYLSLDGGTIRTSSGLKITPDGEQAEMLEGDDCLIPGGDGVDTLLSQSALLGNIRAMAAKPGDGRLLSVCSGALVLAATGVLDGRTATTHWSRESALSRYPRVNWDVDRLYTLGERVCTSAGVSTGIDLALAIIRRDGGSAAALQVARELVVQLRRFGGQNQYADHLASQYAAPDTLGLLIEQVIMRPAADWSLIQMAETAGVTTRTISRQFAQHLGQTPANFVERVRLDRARGLLHDHLPLKRAAAQSGFGDLQRMRRAFKRRYGITIQQYLATFSGDG